MTCGRTRALLFLCRTWAALAFVLSAGLPLASCGPEVPAENLCGNRTIDEGEQCDGTNLSGASCKRLSSAFTGGKLSCDPRSCTFDTRECTVAVASHCGDGVIEGNEECEPGVNDEGRTCGSIGFGRPEADALGVDCNRKTCRWWKLNCTGGTEICGDGRIEGGEECEGDDFNGLACVHLNAGIYTHYSGGTLSCNGCYIVPECWGPNGEHCGNGVLEDGEACDGADVGLHSCDEVGRPVGQVKCYPGCKDVDYTGCTGGCITTPRGVSCR